MKRNKPSGPRDFKGLLAAAIHDHKAGRLADAITNYQKALKFKPAHAETHNNLAHALRSASQREEAVVHYKRAIALKAGYGNAHYNLSQTLAELGRAKEAEEHLQIVYSLEGDPANIHYNRGLNLAIEGRFDEARAEYNRAIEINPNHVNAHLGRALISGPDDAGVKELEDLEARIQQESPDAAPLHFSLAKALEDTGQYAAAFRYYRKGNELKRATIPYDESRTLQSFGEIAAFFSKERMAAYQSAGDSTTRPIFVLGMPRSGSTLIEQILASHPQIHGAGELPVMEGIARSISSTELNADTLRQVADRYLDELPTVPEGILRIVDKMPANFSWVGLIHLAFPNARIIHTMRDPLDTCLSCYTTSFDTGNFFAWDQGELGRYYRQYTELMAHWRLVLPPGRMLDVVYEDVVNDLEGQARRLIEYCGLEWNNRCLRFHENRGRVHTASYAQVRRPLYATSVGRWRRFESDLGPLLRELKDITLSANRVQSAQMF